MPRPTRATLAPHRTSISASSVCNFPHHVSLSSGAHAFPAPSHLIQAQPSTRCASTTHPARCSQASVVGFPTKTWIRHKRPQHLHRTSNSHRPRTDKHHRPGHPAPRQQRQERPPKVSQGRNAEERLDRRVPDDGPRRVVDSARAGSGAFIRAQTEEGPPHTATTARGRGAGETCSTTTTAAATATSRSSRQKPPAAPPASPPGLRHGSVLPITAVQYSALGAAKWAERGGVLCCSSAHGSVHRPVCT